MVKEQRARNKEQKKPWECLSRKEIYSNHWISVLEDQVVKPDGKKGIYGWVRFKQEGVGVVPFDKDGNVYLIRTYRYPTGKWSTEFVSGGVEIISVRITSETLSSNNIRMVLSNITSIGLSKNRILK